MKIQKITLHNFRSYKDQEIDFTPGINIIHGRSNSGKSNIIRAISWTLFGMGSKNEVCRHGENEVSVFIRFDTGLEIMRSHAKSVSYAITYPDGHSKTYNAVGKEIPPEVVEQFNIGEVRFGNDEVNLNIGNQLDNLFLLGESANTVHRWLSYLLALSTVEAAREQCKKDNRKGKGALTTISKLLAGQRERLNRFIEDHKNAYEDAEGLGKTRDAILSLAASLDRHIEWQRLNEDLHKGNIIIGQSDKLTGINSRIQDMDILLSQCKSWQENHITLSKINVVLTLAGRLDLICEDMDEEWQKLVNYRTLVDTFQEVDTLERQHHSATEEVKVLTAKLRNLDVCPLCGTELEAGIPIEN